ncbi:MAG: hypothetical protein C0483_13785 [Pirellula sp.]|nr:hypothetical protein [Pirellula sp.]
MPAPAPTEQNKPIAEIPSSQGSTAGNPGISGDAPGSSEWGPAKRIGFALLAPVVATVVRYYLMTWMGDTAPLVLYPVAILLSALFGGLVGGAVSTVVSSALSWWVFLADAPSETVALRIFALMLNGSVISIIGERIRIERRRANSGDRALRNALSESGQARQALAMQARVLESMAEGVCVFREQGQILFTNPAFDQMFGAERNSLLGTNVADLKDSPPEEARRRYAAALAEARRTNCWEGEQYHRNARGDVFQTHTHITPIQLDQEWCYVSVQEDVTEKRRADEAMHALNQDLRNRVQEMTTLLEVLPIGIGIATDATANNIQTNRALAKTLRIDVTANASLTAAEGERPRGFRIFHEGQEVAADQLPLQQAARLGVEIRDLELDVVFDDGAVSRLLEYAVPLFDDQGRPRGSIGAFLDISERRAAEREREQLVAALTKHGRELSVLSNAAQEVNKVLDASAILRTLVRAALQITEASAGAALLQYPGAPQRPYYRRGDDSATESEPRDADELGAANWVLRHRSPYLANTAATDEVVSPRARELLGIENLVCLPIVGRDDSLLGCLELQNKPGGFSTGDVVKLQALAAGASIALENARLLSQIREADRRKDDFLAMLAHELRNPLAPLRSSVDVLLMLDDGDDTMRQLRGVMDRQISHMGRIIDDLLDVSRITRGRIELRKEQLDWTKLVSDGVEALSGVFDAGGHALRTDFPDSPIWIEGDSTRMAQVLDNLLSNARKFTNSGGEITVRLTAIEDGRRAVLEVCDTGIGVSSEDLGRIFDIFTQADRSLDRRRGGLGLGLALVKGLVDLHGGCVEARSPGIGAGCTIRIELPTIAAPNSVSNDRESPVVERPSLRVIIVEDNRDAAETLRILLETLGHRAATAYEGRGGIELARSFRADAIICDIGLPEMDGFHVARAVRETPELADVRLIALTGYGRDADIRRALESGFDAHLTKPADASQLLHVLADVRPADSWQCEPKAVAEP